MTRRTSSAGAGPRGAAEWLEWAGWLGWAGWLAGWLGVACGSPNHAVARSPHPDGAPAEPVAFLPPPAPIERLDEQPPARGCLWADGQWVWTAQRWDWRPGGWVRPPEGCRYSPPSLEWAPGGETGILYYRPGRWYSVSTLEICADAVSCLSPRPDPQSARAP